MAEIWSKAFGRYLRTLRQRRGLSLQDVCSLSQAFAETLDKGYLSRCENGHQGPAFSKIIPLSRIYDVPADVLLERLELDMELDGVGSPETDGLTYSELTKLGTDAFNRGTRWQAYAFLRDATSIASSVPVKRVFSNAEEQSACAQMNCASAASGLGRFKFAIHEFTHVCDAGGIGARFYPVLLERLSQAHRNVGQHETARRFADEAVQQAELNDEREYMGYLHANRGVQALTDQDPGTAATSFDRAYESFKNVGRKTECAKSLNNLAQAFCDLGRSRAARRALAAAESLLATDREHRSRALGRILMGEIEARDENHTLATRYWREAAEMARKLDDKTLRFKAEYLLLKQAQQRGQLDLARALHRKISQARELDSRQYT